MYAIGIFSFCRIVHLGYFSLIVQLPVESQFVVIDIKLQKPIKFWMQCLGSFFYFIFIVRLIVDFTG